MSGSEWKKVDFQQFVNNFGNDIVIKNAPEILYSKKDKEHEAYNSLIAFFFITGALLIYIALSYFLASIYFSLILFVIILIIGVIVDIFLIVNIIKSNVYIRPLECWVEIYKGKSEGVFEYYCFTFYPIFTGKCHPNEATNVILKLYQEQIIKNKIDITQIEIYFKLTQEENNDVEKLGSFFQYAEGRPFRDDEINRNSWKYFPSERSGLENYVAIGNWDHQYEWKTDLEFDFDKLHEYAPWVIQKWNEINLKPLTEEYKEKINWNLRFIESIPKLKPWEGNLDSQTYENPGAHKDLEIVNEVITKIIGQDKVIKKIKDIKNEIPIIKSYFRGLGS